MIEQVDLEQFSKRDRVFVQNYRDCPKCTEETISKKLRLVSYIVKTSNRI